MRTQQDSLDARRAFEEDVALRHAVLRLACRCQDPGRFLAEIAGIVGRADLSPEWNAAADSWWDMSVPRPY
jgi:hypothetical protein